MTIDDLIIKALEDEANEVCTPDIADKIWEGVCEGIKTAKKDESKLSPESCQ